MQVELADLRYFYYVASARSFAEGAKRAHVTAPAVSKAVKRLEAQLGVQLLHRTTRRVSLTEAGALVLEHCRHVLEILDDLSQDLDGRVSRLRGELRVGATEVLGTFALPYALARLAERAPDLVTRTFTMGHGALKERLLEGAIDVGLTLDTHDSDDLVITPLVRSRISLVCGPNHPLYKRARVTADELDKYPFVVPQPFAGERLPTVDSFPEDRYRRRIGATVERLGTAIEMVHTGAFLGYFPDLAIRRQLDSDVMRRIEGLELDDSVELSALTAAGRPPRSAVRALVDELQSTLRDAMAIVCEAGAAA